MTELNWGMVRSGDTFEALVSTLVWFDDPQARLFRRPGGDGGIDVLSGDRKTVYQAKFHADAATSKAFADARKEANQVTTYLSPGHANYDLWKDVTAWRLVTNATLNPHDEALWATDIAPLFARLKADYWARADLEARLVKHPEVRRAFFSGQLRVFLTLPETAAYVERTTPVGSLQLSERIAHASMVGRERETVAFEDFLGSNAMFLVTSGPGGVGKTRFMLECGWRAAAHTESWQVLWANQASMAVGNWLEAIVPEKPTLLLIDEPDDEKILKILLEQMVPRTGRLARWKIFVAARSPKDPVLGYLRQPAVAPLCANLPLGALEQASAEAFCTALLLSGPLSSWRDEGRLEAARTLANQYDRHPIWMGMAVGILEQDGNLSNLPTTGAALADVYLNEICQNQTDFESTKLLDIIRWISLYGVLNRGDEQSIADISKRCSLDPGTLLRAVKRLVERRGLVSRSQDAGIVEVKPDVIRDRILATWLCVDVGFGARPHRPSAVANQLIGEILASLRTASAPPHVTKTLVALARTEWLAPTDSAVDLLSPLFEGLASETAGLGAAARVVAAELLTTIARVRAHDVVTLSRAWRTHASPDENVPGLFGMRHFSQADVIGALPWLVFHAAMGATVTEERRIVLNEMCDLLAAETRLTEPVRRQWGHEGRTTGPLLGSIVDGGPEFWSDFREEAQALALTHLETVIADPGGVERGLSIHTAVLGVLAPRLLAVERVRTIATKTGVTFENYVIFPEHPAWPSRALLVSRLRAALDNPLPRPVAVELWRLVSDAHSSCLRAYKTVLEEHADAAPPGVLDALRGDLVSDLGWLKQMQATREVPLWEQKHAREVWHWHVQYDNDESLKVPAQELESLFMGTELAAEFEPLLSFENWRNHDGEAQKIADRVQDDAAAICAFLGRAATYLEGSKNAGGIFKVAVELGRRAQAHPAIAEFVRATLRSDVDSLSLDFALEAAHFWTATERKQHGDAANCVRALLDAAPSPAGKARLLNSCYANYHPERLGLLSDDDHALLEGACLTFIQANAAVSYVALIGRLLPSAWDRYVSLVDEALSALPDQQTSEGIRALVDSVHAGLELQRAASAPIPPALRGWVLERFLRSDGKAALGDLAFWHLERIVSICGPEEIEWLAQTLEAASAGRNPTQIGRLRLTRFIKPISAEDSSSLRVVGAIRRIVAMALGRGAVAYHLPDYLHDIDPGGLMVPGLVAEQLRAGESLTRDEYWWFARLATAYATGTDAWRTIALPVAQHAEGLTDSERLALYSVVCDKPGTTMIAAQHEVPGAISWEVQNAQEQFDNESAPPLKRLWAARREAAMANVEAWKRRLAERGEE